MGVALQVLGYIAAVTLQVMILHVMLAGSWRRYPMLFVYVLADLVTNLLEVWPKLNYANLTPAARKSWLWLYWWDERIIQALLFMLVISLIYRASTHWGGRRSLLAILILGSIAFAFTSLWLEYDPNVTTGKWMTPWTRDMNLCAAILDLLLWATLIRTRQRDTRLLMISGALGVQFAAGAMGQALRDVSHGSIDFAAIVIVSSNLACLYIWRQALRLPSFADFRAPLPKSA